MFCSLTILRIMLQWILLPDGFYLQKPMLFFLFYHFEFYFFCQKKLSKTYVQFLQSRICFQFFKNDPWPFIFFRRGTFFKKNKKKRIINWEFHIKGKNCRKNLTCERCWEKSVLCFFSKFHIIPEWPCECKGCCLFK